LLPTDIVLIGEGTEEEFEEVDIEVEKTSTAKAIEALEYAKLWKLL
jgi:hypothetical protein